jgi:predicted PurR-regulated permease PerM
MLICLLVGPTTTLIVVALQQGSALASWMATSDVPAAKDILSRMAGIGFLSQLGIDEASIQESLRSMAQSMSQFAARNLLRFASEVTQIGLQGALAILAAFFFLRDGSHAVAWLVSILPMNVAIQKTIKDSFRDTVLAVVWATTAAAAAQALMMLAGFALLGIPAAFLAGGATFVFAWVPMLGSFPVWGLGLVYLLIQGAYIKALILLGIGLVTTVVDNIIRPLVLKGRSAMHPMVSLVAIFGGIEMFGVPGVFLGPILIAILLTLLKIWPVLGRESGLEFPRQTTDEQPGL